MQRLRYLLFSGLAALLVLTGLELGCFVLLGLAAGEPVTWGELEQRRARRVAEEPNAAVERPADRSTAAAQPLALHPYIGYVIDPGRHWAAQDPDFSRQAADYGFAPNREEILRPRSDAEFVIAIFGGSVAAGFAALPGLIERELGHLERFAGRRLVILSLSVAGHKQPQQLMALNFFLAMGAHFDLVINLDGFNEIALAPTTNLPHGYAAVYPRGWRELVGDLDPELRRQRAEVEFLRRRRAAWARRFSGPLLARSLTAGTVWTLGDRALSDDLSAAEHHLLETDRSPSDTYQARGPRADPAIALDDHLVALWRRTSALMHAACRQHGIDYLHLLQPNQYVAGSKPLTRKELETAWDPANPYKPSVERAYPKLIEAGRTLRRQGVAFHDLTGVFAEVEETLYIDRCCHLNRRGYRWLARAVAAALEESFPI